MRLLSTGWSTLPVLLSRTKGTIGSLGNRLGYARYSHSLTSDELQNELKVAGFQVVHGSIECDSGHAVDLAE
jgi:hypothetical protein